jgi:phenylpropionate dioxygenase-like ring-hydroxylating dioxygenase large terminal subunit
MFLRNAWYVAAWSREIGRDLHAITVLGEAICVYRAEDGSVVALEDACPHRKLPLSMGRLKGDAVECGYHGLTFDCAGACIGGPGKVPASARVRSYPVVERYEMAWIWMGDPALADPAKIIELAHYDDPAWGVNRGDAIDLECNYLYVTDNLLDPSHVAWVHQSSFGQSATRDTPLRITKGDDGITVWRWMMDVEVAPFYAKLVPFEGNADRLQHYEVRYPAHRDHQGVCSSRRDRRAGDGPIHEKAFIMDSYNFMTPETETPTRYYWFQMRNIRPDDAALSKMMSADVKHAFEEDRVVLNAVQKGMDGAASPTIDLEIDAGPLRFRRQIAALIDAERRDAQALAV